MQLAKPFFKQLNKFMQKSKLPLSNSDAKWIQLSKLTYERDGKRFNWEMVERKHKKSKVDAIIIAPLLIGDGKPKTLLTLQYRPPIDKISVEFPAGLTDKGELAETTALRELKEETGYYGKVVHTSPVLSSDPGLTNASFQIVTVQIDLQDKRNKNPSQDLQGDESIELKVVDIDNLLNTLDKLSVDCQVDGKLYHYAMGLANNAVKTCLSPIELDSYHRDGILAIPNVLTDAECDLLINRANELSNEFDPNSSPIFTTNEKNHINNDYFLQSHNNISYFLEEDASKEQILKKNNCINKIGHALHILDPIYKSISDKAIVYNICKQLKMTSPHIMQSMVIFKQPHIGSKVNPHQDGTFLQTPNLLGFWFALEDVHLTNGCLEVAKQSHLLPIAKTFNKIGSTTEFKQLHDTPTDLEYEPVLVKKGSLVLIHGNVYHQSRPNKSDHSRIIYTFHCADLKETWYDANWIPLGPTNYKL